MIVDAHLHFWNLTKAEYSWLVPEYGPIYANLEAPDVEPHLIANGIDKTVIVQAANSYEDTAYMLEVADRHAWAGGVVGWVDLRAEDVRSQLRRYAARPKFKGVRHIVHDEPDVEFMLTPEFRRGIGALAEFGLTYDLLVRPAHLPAALKLARDFPQQLFVIDHLAKPPIRTREFSPWRGDLASLARCENVFCKLSGMVTETHWRGWKPEDFAAYLDVVFDAFGAERLMIGSDWPVCTLSGDYRSVMEIVLRYIERLPLPMRGWVLGGSCARFYHVC